MINLPIIYRFFQLIYRLSSIGRTGNLPIFNRLNSINYRSGWFAPVLTFWKPDANHQLIVNPYAVIINLSSANPSIIHRRTSNGNAARKRDQGPDAVSAYSVQSIDNPSTELWNPSTDTLLNPPIIDRRNRQIDRSGCRKRSSVELSDNRQAICSNRETPSPMDRPSASPNRKVIVKRCPLIVNSVAFRAPIFDRKSTEENPRIDRSGPRERTDR